MECRFEHDLFRRIALRFVESSCRFRLTKDVGHAVITDAIARTEIAVRVVVKSTPSNATGILRTRRNLVMDAGVAQGVLNQPLDIIDGLSWMGMPDKLGVQISRMVGWPQRKTEVIHRENVFQQFGLIVVADAARLSRWIELMGQRVGASVKIMIVLGLVDSHAP